MSLNKHAWKFENYLCLASILSLKCCLSYFSSLSTHFASSMSIPTLISDSYSLARLETFSFAWSNTAWNKNSYETAVQAGIAQWILWLVSWHHFICLLYGQHILRTEIRFTDQSRSFFLLQSIQMSSATPSPFGMGGGILRLCTSPSGSNNVFLLAIIFFLRIFSAKATFVMTFFFELHQTISSGSWISISNSWSLHFNFSTFSSLSLSPAS